MKNPYIKILNLLNRPFVLFDQKRNRLLFACGATIYCALFLYLFVPFNITNWIVYTSPFKALGLPAIVIISGILIFFSQYIQSKWFAGKSLKIYHLLVSFIAEVLFVTLPLSMLYSLPSNSIFIEFAQTLQLVVLLLGLWYVLGLAILKIINIEYTEKELPEEPVMKKNISAIERINISDENGQLRLSLKQEDALYFESSDNYVIVHYRKDQRIAKELVRTSLKNIENTLKEFNCIRCHRSYIVNMQSVSFIKKDGRVYEIAIQGTTAIIPISRSYVKVIKELLTT